VTAIEILCCGGDNYVEVYVNNKPLLDSFSFLRGIVVPFAILDILVSSWSSCNKVIEKEAVEAIWKVEDEDEKNGSSWVKAHQPEVAFFKTCCIRMLILPAGATITALLGPKFIKELISGASYLKKAKIFKDAHLHISFGSIAVVQGFNSLEKVVFSRIRSFAIKVSARTTKYAIVHPKQFRHRLAQLKVALHWLKFLAPLIGTLNKLKGNMVDMYKKARQRRNALIAQKVRRRLLGKLTDEERLEDAVKHIQATWRAKRSRKLAMIIKKWKQTNEISAALKIQAIYRARRAKQRVQTRNQEEELRQLELEDEDNLGEKTKKKKLSRAEKKKIKKRRQTIRDLRSEVRDFKRMEESDKSLLLRPNTAFSCWWKIIRVSVIGLEVLQLILPRLLLEKGTKMSLDELLATMLLPPKECLMDPEDFAPPKKGIFKVFSKKNVTATMLADMCTPLSPARVTWIQFLQFFIRWICHFTNFICFFDVPITFFTGEFDKYTGVLVPKPFFPRWILPGLLLQLLVNPVMADVTNVVKAVLTRANSIDIGRLLRWAFALLPVTYAFVVECFVRLTAGIKSFIKKQNEITVQTSLS